MKKVIKDNPIVFLLLTFLLTRVLMMASEYLLNYYVNSDPSHRFYTYTYTIGSIGFILVVPSAMLAAWLIRFFKRFRDSKFSTTGRQGMGREKVSINKVINQREVSDNQVKKDRNQQEIRLTEGLRARRKQVDLERVRRVRRN